MESIRKYINACLCQKTFTPVCEEDELVKIVKQYSQKEYSEYDDWYAYTVWFAVRVLFTKHFKCVTYSDVVNDVLNFDREYCLAYLHNNCKKIDKYCLARPTGLHDHYFICNVHYTANDIAKFFASDCSDNCIPSLLTGICKQSYIVNPVKEITRVLSYLRAVDSGERYMIDWRGQTHFDLVDWVQKEVRLDACNNLKVWFAVRLLVLNGFKKVTLKQVGKMRVENPTEFDKCVDHSETLYLAMQRVQTKSNNILNNCRTFGGSFKYNGYLPYSYKLPAIVLLL